MDRCPLCRATLNGAEACRRCRAELGNAQLVERQGEALVDAAIHHLSRDDIVAAERLLRRAMTLHATPRTKALWQLARRSARPLAALPGVDIRRYENWCPGKELP